MMIKTTTNEFEKSCTLVNSIISEYRNIRKEYNIPDDGFNSRTIEDIAKPFIKGYFTLAIVGKVSSGKSTFINALLGCKDLLAVGHDQTTCGITTIEYGEKPEAQISFGDNSKKEIKGSDFNQELKKYVAIPEKFHDLPVNAIDEMILAGFTFDKIWESRKEIEEKTLCSKIDKILLKELVDSKPKKNVVVSIEIKFPFNEELKGWRIIDTPGVGAIGGIEDTTRQLLEKKKENGSRAVDSIIFLQKGNETLDQTDTKKFVQDQLDNFTDEDKKRLFFVLTHASDQNFLVNKENKLNSLKKNYNNQISRLSYVDSFLFSFINELQNIDIDLKSLMEDDFVLKNWDENELEEIGTILYRAKRELKKDKDTVNNETLHRKITEWANFDVFKSEINQFAEKEITQELAKLFFLINSDYSSFVERLEKDNTLLKEGTKALDKAIEEILKKKNEYSNSMRAASQETSRDQIVKNFLFIDNELDKVKNQNSIASIRTIITNIYDNVYSKEKEVFSNIINRYRSFLGNIEFNDTIIQSIDFGQIEKNASAGSRERYEVTPEQTIEGGWCEEDKKVAAKYDTRINETKKLQAFKTVALKEAKNNRRIFEKQIKTKADNIEKAITEELSKKINSEEKRLNELKGKMNNSQTEIKNNSELILKIKTTLENSPLKKDSYGRSN
ncbi:dynamin family protein [Polaribacter sp. 20A6]|uniref:dynamin family protein n=1 Tax=Polaribacter sp. 20A6 TaxID=2687289 RepID=UPI0013FDF8FE|nr:dynamin family protein [Polaribacter sp. 20A6]